MHVVLAHDKFESIGKQRFQHLPQAIGRGALRRQRRDVEAIPLEPARSAANPLRLRHVIRGANQIEHVRVADLIPVAAQEAAAHALLLTRADLDAGDVKGRPWRRCLPENGNRERGHDTEGHQQPFHMKSPAVTVFSSP